MLLAFFITNTKFEFIMFQDGSKANNNIEAIPGEESS